jgi:hypothetical protein
MGFLPLPLISKSFFQQNPNHLRSAFMWPTPPFHLVPLVFESTTRLIYRGKTNLWFFHRLGEDTQCQLTTSENTHQFTLLQRIVRIFPGGTLQ